MVVQSFNIKFKGVDHPVEFEDDMEFGKFEKIIQKCSNFGEGSNPVDNVQAYRREIMLNALKKVIFTKPERHYFKIDEKSYIHKRFMNTTGG